MKFSEIKHKIKNLGNFKSLEEIKKASLRIVRNTKTGDYWLIEEEFLKPVIKSPRECKTILIKPEDLKYKVLMVHKSKEELKGKKVLDYIEWGEKQGFHKRPTCKSRKWWWGLEEIGVADFLWPNAFNDRFGVFINQGFRTDMRMYLLILKDKRFFNSIVFLNSVLNVVNIELFGIANLGEGVIYTNVYQVPENIVMIPEKSIDVKIFQKYAPKSIFTELGFDSNKPIREQEPNPLPDRKALDDIVFDALGLTEEERKEVYWAVAELVQNRLKKAKSV
jgi:hypothetical protein